MLTFLGRLMAVRRAARGAPVAFWCALLPTVAYLAPGVSSAADNPPAGAPIARRAGRLIRVPAPITDSVEKRVRRTAVKFLEQARRAGQEPLLVVDILPGQNDFGKALDLARFLSGESLAGARTVAYAQGNLTGHSVLVALACDEIALGPESQFGNAGADEANITPDMRSVYAEIAGRRKTVPVDLALGMLDPALEVLSVETELSREFVLSQRLEAVKNERTVQSTKVIVRAGEPGLFTAAQARELGIVSLLADDRTALARTLGLSREAMEEDPSLGESWRTVRIALKGELALGVVRRYMRVLDEEFRRRDVNLVLVEIDSRGGSLTDSLTLANFLTDLDPARRRTVAYVANEARGEAALVALACDHIVMHPDAVLGGPGDFPWDAEELKAAAVTVGEIAERKGRSPALARAMIDPQVRVFRYTRTTDGLVDYFTVEDAAQQAKPEEWQQGPELGAPGEALQLAAEKAFDCGVARYVVGDFAEFKQQYNLERDPVLAQPSWVDSLAEALNSFAGSLTLLTLAFVALYIEMHTPGVGVAGLTALLCFLLYFWSNFFGGNADWLEVLMFLAGAACLAVELLILPGFGIFGFTGAALILGSLVLASQTFFLPHNAYQLRQLRGSMVTVGGAILATGAAAYLLRRVLFTTPLFRQVVLEPPQGSERQEIAKRESLRSYDHLVGEIGTVLTPLRPAGKIRVGDQFVDVVADGEIVDVGERVEVVSARGNHIVVRSVG